MKSYQPRIVVLDGWTTNPGDLSWGPLEKIGPTTVYQRTAPEEVIDRAADAEVVLLNKTRLSREAMQRLPNLRFIGVLATGYDVIDIEAATAQGIVVANVPAYSTQSVAQLVFAHLLNFAQHVADHARAVDQGGWADCPDFCFWNEPLIELSGLTMGIVGFGRIGRNTARLAHCFGMQVIANNRSPVEPPDYVRMVELETIFRDSDVVSLHCPLNSDNEKLVDTKRLGLMKPTAMLINTARGGLIDEAALESALREGQIAGAGLDVLGTEPPPANHPLYRLENCHITPHIAWATRAARTRLLEATAENLAAYLQGVPQNVVNR